MFISDLRLPHDVARVYPGTSKQAGAIPGHSKVFSACPALPALLACPACRVCLLRLCSLQEHLGGGGGQALQMLWCCEPPFSPCSRCLVPSGRSRTAAGSGDGCQGGEVCSDRTVIPLQLHSTCGFTQLYVCRDQAGSAVTGQCQAMSRQCPVPPLHHQHCVAQVGHSCRHSQLVGVALSCRWDRGQAKAARWPRGLEETGMSMEAVVAAGDRWAAPNSRHSLLCGTVTLCWQDTCHGRGLVAHCECSWLVAGSCPIVSAGSALS